jgi:cathepsin L
MFRSVAVAALIGGASGFLHDRSYYEAKFINWMNEHKVNFKDGEEFAHRLSIFASNDDYITEENAKNLPYTLGHNEYSMYTFDEFAELKGLNRPFPAPRLGDFVHNNEDTVNVPTSVDWVSAGAVTGVKNQGNCGSCWSFSTTGCLEGARKIRYGSLTSLSEQELVDCDPYDSGCNGGWMTNAFYWVQSNGGLCSESAYPYTSGSTGKAGTCKKSSCSSVSYTRPSGWADISTSESALQTAVAQQPTSVALEASSAWQLYSGGIFTGSCGTSLNHGVLAVGYGTSSGMNYWKVKNSWGTSWGESGYIRMQKDIGTYGGKCGITLGASYASV